MERNSKMIQKYSLRIHFHKLMIDFQNQAKILKKNNKRLSKLAIVNKVAKADEDKSCNLNQWNWIKEISLIISELKLVNDIVKTFQ